LGIVGILAELDSEIARLQQARAVLTADTKWGRGRPKTVGTVQKPAEKKRKPYRISPEGRARIAAAVKRRWAAQKKAAGK
jgi:hypothetical protein